MTFRPVILVVGGSGFLGSHVVDCLAREDVNIRVLDLVHGDKPGVEYIVGDIIDPEVCLRACHGASGVIHCASVVDLGVAHNPYTEAVNVTGTSNIIQACRKQNVTALVYTSSMDVVFSGQPILNGTEEMPYADRYWNEYIRTKVMAERMALEASDSPDQNALSCASLRCAHIFGPGDTMISTIVSMIKQKQLSFAFGGGVNDYVYVENCARAHVQCLWRLLQHPQDTAGQAFCIVDHRSSMWEHMRPFLDHVGLKPPTKRLPLAVVYIISLLVLLMSRCFDLFGIRWAPDFNAYSVLAVGQDYSFSAKKAFDGFGFVPIVGRKQAVNKTLPWLRSILLHEVNETSAQGQPVLAVDSLAATRVRGSKPHAVINAIHLIYGLVYCALGGALFVAPSSTAATIFGLDELPANDPAATIQQTAGLIIFVLGTYSLAAVIQRWPAVFSRLAWQPKVLTAFCIYAMIMADVVPTNMAVLAFIELAVGLVMAGAIAASSWSIIDPTPSISLYTDLAAWVQLVHSSFSVAFIVGMLFAQQVFLPLAFPSAESSASPTALSAWAALCGAYEIMMACTYGLSGPVDQMECFARFSVVSRCGAGLILLAGYIAGICHQSQVLGVAPDVILAILTAISVKLRHSGGSAKKKD